MNRRKFLENNVIAGSGLMLGGNLFAGNSQNISAEFKLNYAPHLGMFKSVVGGDPIAQLNYMAEQGFTAFEDNTMKGRPVALQEQMAETMKSHNMKMGVFVAHSISWKEPNLANGDVNLQEQFLEEIEESVEVAKRVNAKWVTVVPGAVDHRLAPEYQTANVVDSLRKASAILEPHGLIMVLEPLNFRNHPGMFLTESPQAYQICKAVNSPSCKILFDVYHQQIQEGNLIPNIDACWDEIAYFQVGDNPGRKEPGTGEINYKNIFRHIYNKGFKGVVGMEHGNANKGKDGALAVIKAYRESDDFQ